MFARVIPLGIAAVAATVLAAPVTLACENPDNITISLRDAPPENVEPGVIVLELDAGSMQVIERKPTIIKEQEFSLQLDNRLASYNVVRVLVGPYSEPTARVSMYTDSCHELGGGTSGFSYLVARSVVEEGGFTFLEPRPITGAELRAKWDKTPEAAN